MVHRSSVCPGRSVAKYVLGWQRLGHQVSVKGLAMSLKKGLIPPSRPETGAGTSWGCLVTEPCGVRTGGHCVICGHALGSTLGTSANHAVLGHTLKMMMMMIALATTNYLPDSYR